MKKTLIYNGIFLILFIISTPSSAGLIDTYSQLKSKQQSNHDYLEDRPVYNNLKTGCSELNSITGLGFTTVNSVSTCYQGGSRIVNSFTILDLVFSKLPGYESLPDMITAAIHITYFASSFSHSRNFGNADLSISTRLGSTWDFANIINNNRLQFGVQSVLETHPFSFNINTAQTLKVNAEFNEPTLTNILGNGRHFGQGSMALRLGGSPVFMLPTGYTVNSNSANIVNNWYKGFDPLAKNIAVPEPSTLSILLLALLFFTIRLFKTNIKHKA